MEDVTMQKYTENSGLMIVAFRLKYLSPVCNWLYFDAIWVTGDEYDVLNEMFVHSYHQF